MDDSNILVLGLASGEHIIAEVTPSNGAYACTNILQIITDTSPEGNVSMGAVPYMPYTTGDLMVPTATTTVATPGEMLLQHYKKMFGKIILPESSIIL